MKHFTTIVAILVLPFLLSNLQAQEPLKASGERSIADLAWLAGPWEGEVSGNRTEEHWMAPSGGMMLGMNRSVNRSGKASFEFLRIAETKDGIDYFASPSGRPETAFKLKEIKDQSATFENLDHDFPQRIIYRRENDSLTARIEGKVNGKEKSMEWKWNVALLPMPSTKK